MAMGRRGVVTERQGIENDMTERLLERAGLEAERSEATGCWSSVRRSWSKKNTDRAFQKAAGAQGRGGPYQTITRADEGPPGPDLARMGLACVAVSRVEDIEAMKKAGLNPARVSFEKPELVCELKAWRNMTEAEVREVWKAVQEVAPEARPCGRAGAMPSRSRTSGQRSGLYSWTGP